MGLFKRKQAAAWVLEEDVEAAYGHLRAFKAGIPMDRDDIMKALTLLVLDMREDR
jgi:hypothetical protein